MHYPAAAAALALSLAGHASAQPTGAEWIGVFTNAAPSATSWTYSMQKVGGAYADATMLMVFIPTSTPTEAGMEAEEADAATLIAGTCADTAPGAITVAAEGSCYNFVPDQSAAQSTWTIDVTGLGGLVIAAQHVPTEFEDDRHYLYVTGTSYTDIEPIAQEGGGGHAHAHGAAEICACAATEADHPFSLDCDDRDAIAASAAKLESADCVASTEGCDAVVDGMMPCRGAYFHIHYIHGWCPDSSMLLSEEQTLHDYEAHCPMCVVERPFVEGHPVCVQPDCDDVAAAEAQALILSSGSANGGTACVEEGADGTCCRNDAEIAAWRQVLAYHDMCGENDMPAAIEMGKHHYAHACEASNCNVALPSYDGSVCPPDSPGTDSGPATQSAGSVATVALAAVAAAVAAAL